MPLMILVGKLMNKLQVALTTLTVDIYKSWVNQNHTVVDTNTHPEINRLKLAKLPLLNSPYLFYLMYEMDGRSVVHSAH